MRACYSLSIILLALLSRVRAEPVRVVATIPHEAELKTGASDSRPMKDVEVTGFISKNGDIFELADSDSMGSIVPRKKLETEPEMARSMDSIEARQEPELGPGMTMCRYGTIVVYSDEECDTFLKPSASLGKPIKTQYKGDKTELQEPEQEVQKPVKKPVKKPVQKPQKQRRNRRKPLRKKAQKKRKNKKRKNQVRRKPQKQQVKKKRRRNPPTQQQKKKRRRNQKRKNQQRRGGNGNKKRKRFDRDEETRAYPEPEAEPLQFAVIYERL